MQLTQLLQRLRDDAGDHSTLDAIIPLVYAELKKLATTHLRREAGPIPLESTDLVHEAFLRLAGSNHPCYEDRAHFFGIASRLMRQVLVDTARARKATKRGHGKEVGVDEIPDWAPQPDRAVLVLNDVLQQLERADPLKGQLIEMRHFAGMTAEESSAALDVPVHRVRRELRLAQAWVRREMSGVEAGRNSGRTGVFAAEPGAA